MSALSLCLSLAACNTSDHTPRPEPSTESNSSPSKQDPSSAQKQTSAEASKPQDSGGIPAPADVAAPPPQAEKTSSGLASVVLKPGSGDLKPTAEDSVTVHYTGWTKDGRMFDSSELRGQPATFALKGVIKGWTEGLQLMTKGEKRRFWIPADLAYGETPRRPGAPAGQLTFDVELLDIVQAPKAPPDVAAPPKDAKKTPSGLAYKVLQKGTGTQHPTATSRVTVHYSGWTTDGKLFDSSVTRGRPATFALNQVIAGWTEGVQLMVPGEKTRFWIPEDLAYKGRPGAPAGMLVFDIELIDIVQAPKAPSDVAAPPKDAQKTASGPDDKALQKGTGTQHSTAH